MATAKDTTMRRFVLERTKDVSGTSGTGVVAEGIEFSNGQVVIHWISQLEAINVYANNKVLTGIHGHGGNTTVRWLDSDAQDQKEASRLLLEQPSSDVPRRNRRNSRNVLPKE